MWYVIENIDGYLEVQNAPDLMKVAAVAGPFTEKESADDVIAKIYVEEMERDRIEQLEELEYEYLKEDWGDK